jgi:tetratricopeptide (TPR) repeat protein
LTITILLNHATKKINTDYNQAIVAYDKAIELKPDFLDSLINKTNTLLEAYRDQEALNACDTAISIYPDNISVLKNKDYLFIIFRDIPNQWTSLIRQPKFIQTTAIYGTRRLTFMTRC